MTMTTTMTTTTTMTITRTRTSANTSTITSTITSTSTIKIAVRYGVAPRDDILQYRRVVGRWIAGRARERAQLGAERGAGRNGME